MAGPKDFIMNSLQSLQAIEAALPLPLPALSQPLISLAAALPELPKIDEPAAEMQLPGNVTVKWEASQ